MTINYPFVRTSLASESRAQVFRPSRERERESLGGLSADCAPARSSAFESMHASRLSTSGPEQEGQIERRPVGCLAVCRLMLLQLANASNQTRTSKVVRLIGSCNLLTFTCSI